MSTTHIQVNKDGTIESRRTLLWSGKKAGQKDIIQSIFGTPTWNISALDNISGSHWKLEVDSAIISYKINLYISSIRDEDRSDDEFKMQLGSSYPDSDEDGWITVILGIYCIDNLDGNVGYILTGYRKEGYNFASNPSLRGTRSKDLQKAYIKGFIKTDRTYIFRPEFIYYYIEEYVLSPESNSESSDMGDNNGIDYNIAEIPQVMKNFISALKTKPFLLLAGISGTGKSQKVKELAYMTCPDNNGLQADKSTPGNYCLIEVKPNWHDSTELLGYYSNLTQKYNITPFLHFVYKATRNPTVPFFVCLDEMNLAPVEQYFAEYLSVLETRAVQDGKIVSAELLSKKIFEGCEIKHDYTESEKEILDYLKENGLRLPENLFVVVTVNMDDTTHQFSRKVIDRAFTIEMNGDGLSEMFNEDNEKTLEYAAEPLPLDALKPKYVRAADALKDEKIAPYKNDITTKVPAILGAINNILKNTPFRVSYRVQNELVLYLSTLILNSGDSVNIKKLIDEASLVILLEKILPRVQGDEKLLNTESGNVFKRLKELISADRTEDAKSALFTEICAKLDEMDNRLTNTYFANFF